MTFADKLRGTQGPVVVQFQAPWCGPCKALAPVVDKLEQEFAGRASVVRIDVEAEPALAREAGVRGVPTLVAYRDGTEVRRHTGGLDSHGLRTFFQSALGEVAASKPLGKPAWHLAAKVGAGIGLLVLSSLVPVLEWTKWVGLGVMFWALRDMCPACQSAAPSR